MSGPLRFMTPRAVPWSSWEEWDYVRENLWSGNVIKQVCALEIIGMWRHRGKLPHGIESTAILTEALIRDQQGISSSTNLSSNIRSQTEIRNFYGSCIIRSINGLVDPSQKGVFAESIYNIGNRIGLPGWLIELRHDCTHDILPSLSLLRSGVRELLNWFLNNYWNMQQSYLNELSAICMPIPSSSSSSSSSNDNNEVDSNNTMNRNDVGRIGKNHRFQNGTGSGTFITSILFPIIIQSTILTPDLESNSRNIENLVHNRIQMWQQFMIDEFDDLMPLCRHLLTCRIVSNLLDQFSSINSEKNRCDITWALCLCKIWLQEQLHRNVISSNEVESKGDSYDGNMSILPVKGKRRNVMTEESYTETVHSMLDAIVYRIENISDIPAYYSENMSTIKILIAQLKGQMIIVNNKSITQDASSSVENDVISNKRQKMEDTTHETSSSSSLSSQLSVNQRVNWKVASDFPAWPFGLVPGKTSTKDLYMIQEI